jgi:hypothetical protein
MEMSTTTLVLLIGWIPSGILGVFAALGWLWLEELDRRHNWTFSKSAPVILRLGAVVILLVLGPIGLAAVTWMCVLSGTWLLGQALKKKCKVCKIPIVTMGKRENSED